MTDFPKLLTPKEIATVFRCDKSTISKWIKDGTIPKEFVFRPSGNRQGCKVLISDKAIEALLTPAQEESGNLKHYQKHNDSDSYQRLLSRF